MEQIFYGFFEDPSPDAAPEYDIRTHSLMYSAPSYAAKRSYDCSEWRLSEMTNPQLQIESAYKDVVENQFTQLLDKWPYATFAPRPNGGALICVPNIKLAPGVWNRQTATIWFSVPTCYPFVCPNHFYLDGDFAYASGGAPSHTVTARPFELDGEGPLWQRCLVLPINWDPNTCTLTTFVHICQQWFMRRSVGFEA